jgi:hypothetical protein
MGSVIRREKAISKSLFTFGHFFLLVFKGYTVFFSKFGAVRHGRLDIMRDMPKMICLMAAGDLIPMLLVITTKHWKKLSKRQLK